MKYNVKTSDNKKLNLSESDLFDILSSKIDVQTPKPEIEAITTVLYKSLEANKIVTPLLSKNLMMNIFYISFSLGYYYRLFLEKNNVEIEEENEENTINNINKSNEK